ncbi:malonate transporter subunit MadL [Bacillus taeanensis]|uniref:Malonate transporter subunit MadL n=1 Tax=Bacillus taeanensis TaxID=273032 RepID=A0A366XZV7_9BACI|nr:malonate transporter subunit MadL [Bacillus taeanensis]RBW71108.1 malonate transporter subunit MadL [Bacillus taeanensis]
MVIYGVALLSICMLLGVFFGELLGKIVGVDSNIGGVGIAMLLLIFLSNYLIKKGKLNKPSESGIAFWSSMYIPIVVAMAAKQNVVAAVKAGPLALIAGVSAVVVSFALVPLLSKIGKNENQNELDTYQNETAAAYDEAK